MEKTLKKSLRSDMMKIFGLCWFVYFTANIGRLSYSAVMAAIISERSYTQSECGLIGTGLYVCYGVSQLFAGGIGDYVSPGKMIFVGMGLSAAMNFCMGIAGTPGQMLAFWCVNGVAQAMLWPPIIRVFSEKLYGEFKKKACVYISTTFAAGTLTVYFLAGMLLDYVGFQGIFRLTAVLMGTVAVIWYILYGELDRRMSERVNGIEEKTLCKEIGEKGKKMSLKMIIVLVILSVALIMQGMLRDGVTSWVPAYLEGMYHKGLQSSTLATMILPVVNLAGIYAAETIRKRKGKSEIMVSALLFFVAACAAGLTIVCGKMSMGISLGSFAVITSCMLGINTMIVNVIPIYFAWTGKVSLISGILNSCVYVGSSISIYGIGAIAETFGWELLPVFLLAAAIVGGGLCLPAKWIWGK